jgi:hypothetical protein
MSSHTPRNTCDTGEVQRFEGADAAPQSVSAQHGAGCFNGIWVKRCEPPRFLSVEKLCVVAVQ